MRNYLLFAACFVGKLLMAGNITLTIKNPNPVDQQDAPVVVQLNNFKKIGQRLL